MRPIAATAQLARRILDLLLLILIVVSLFGVALGKLVPLTGNQTLAIGGASMSPAIPVGAAVIVSRVPADELAVGDVVSLVAGQSRSVFTHRIVEIVDGDRGIAIRTRGDANDAPDPTLVPEADIIGRVTWTIPYAGYVITLLSLPVGVAFVLGLALALLSCAWLLESVELRGAARRRRVLRKIPVWLPTATDGWLPAGPPLVASGVGERVAAHLGGTGHPLAATVRPAGPDWVLPGRVVPASRSGRRR